MKDIDAFYYGYGDEDDGVILPLEKEEENEGNGTLFKACCVYICVVNSKTGVSFYGTEVYSMIALARSLQIV